MPVESPIKQLRRQITAAWQTKLLIAFALPILFCVPYFLLQRHLIFQPRLLPPSWLDRLVPFDPAWTVVYLSFHAIVYLLPWVGRSRGDMWRFGIGFTLLSSLSFTCFLLLPVTGPRPLYTGDSWMYRTVILCDKPLNSFPSLHAGLLVYTLAFGWRMTRQWVPRWAVAAMLIWSGLVLYSTMATKEHYAIDLLAGGLLALICDAIAWRWKTEIGSLARTLIKLPALLLR